jgi:hypothetical protein
MPGDRRTVEVVLLDAEGQHREAPRTFSIPRRAVREALVPGDLVKLLFVVEPPVGSVTVERIWVEVVEANADGYVGRLANRAAFVTGIEPGDRVRFAPEHVAARDAGEDDPHYTDPNAFAVVSRRVWDDDAWPRRLERRDIPDPQFSGWFVLAGDEPAPYLAAPANFVPIAHASLFDRFRVLDSGLEGPVGTTMEWDESALEFVGTPSAGA